MYPAEAIANTFLEYARAESRPMTHMQLQKLIYLAHGWHLGLTGEPLIIDPVSAWTYGPVIMGLYDELKHHGEYPIFKPLAWWDDEAGQFSAQPPKFEPKTADVLRRVWDAYKHLSGVQLSTLTHRKGSPWDKLVGNWPEDERQNVTIPNSQTRAYYHHLAQKAG